MNRNQLWSLVLVAALTPVVGCATINGAGRDVPDAQFGSYHRPVTTDSQPAQQWFDHGLQWMYGFNHDEAIRSFERALEFDPDLAMAWWGIAYAYGPHINKPMMTDEESALAYEAAQEAMQRRDDVTPAERDLIEAVAVRYEMPVPENRTSLDEAHAQAMQRVWEAHPDDPDVGAIYAESLMNLQPWDLWTPDGEPKGRAEEIVAVLEQVMDLDVRHPGANHFYIHAVEASPDPQRALASAERLPDIVPGSGHLVHMPAHIYARLGRWTEATDANEKAIEIDRSYLNGEVRPDLYAVYYLHNLHFLAWSAMMEGRYERSLNAARELERDMPEQLLQEMAFMTDGMMPVTYHVLIRFGRWEQILEEPEPQAHRHVSRAHWRHARSIALSNLGRISEARTELAEFEIEAEQIPEDWEISLNNAREVMQVAKYMAEGELAFHDGRPDDAFAALREAVRIEDSLRYAEPSAWMHPARHALGALLLAEGHAEEAETVYRNDLERYPNNGWSLLGLQQSLDAQGKLDEAEAIQDNVARAWARADIRPVASCFCHPAAR